MIASTTVATAATTSPVTLSYVASLRGITPRRPGESFSYLLADCRAPEVLIGLAASNPEGRFYGLIADSDMAEAARQAARLRQVSNVMFFAASPRQMLAWLDKDPAVLPDLHYLCADESLHSLPAAEREALFDLAARKLRASGLLSLGYRAYGAEDGHLRFLVREVAPEMNAQQASVFLLELKKLGGFYFGKHPDRAAALDRAIAGKLPDAFFQLFDDAPAKAASFDTLVAMRKRGFAYAGDSHIPANYIELATPPEAHQVIETVQHSPLYEVIKDFAADRMIRGDIWCKLPVEQSADPAILFGSFAYGITESRENIPSVFQAQGKAIPLDAPLYEKLIELMTLMPAGIGDFLARPGNEGFAPKDVIGALQILIACGVARPMRGVREAGTHGSLSQPRLSGAFNRHLAQTRVTDAALPLASLVMGDVITVSARDALVMQALGRAGIADAATALLPELERIAKDPLATRVMDGTAPTSETAQKMVNDSVLHSMVQWYAYGLLEAA